METDKADEKEYDRAKKPPANDLESVWDRQTEKKR